MGRRSNEETKAIKTEVLRLYEEGCDALEIASKLNITSHYARYIIRGEDKELIKQGEFIKEWGAVHRWYRKHKDRERVRQQAIEDSILIPGEEYSRGPGWL